MCLRWLHAIVGTHHHLLKPIFRLPTLLHRPPIDRGNIDLRNVPRINNNMSPWPFKGDTGEARPQSNFLKKIFWGRKSFLCGHWYPYFGLLVMSLLGFKGRVGSLIWTWWRHVWYMFPEIHLWCDTCWPLDGQHSSRSLPHMHVSAEVGCRIRSGDLPV